MTRIIIAAVTLLALAACDPLFKMKGVSLSEVSHNAPALEVRDAAGNVLLRAENYADLR